MSDFRSYDFGRDNTISVIKTRNKVLRNTYWLLALSMLPTVIGSWLGIVTGLAHLMMIRPGITLVTFFFGSMGLMFAIERNRESNFGVALLLIFTFFMGLMLSRLVGFVLGSHNGAILIGLAFSGTSIIFTIMATIASVSKRDFSGLGRWLMMGVVVLLLAIVANIFLKLPSIMLTILVLSIFIFSAFILVDIQRVIKGGETNYISATLSIYLNLYNVFSNLLILLRIFSGNFESNRD